MTYRNSAAVEVRQLMATLTPEEPGLLEVCCGCARLSRSVAEEGFPALGVDRHDNEHKTEWRWVSLDLTVEANQELVLDAIASGSVALAWLGVACGTASRAREKPISAHLRNQAVPLAPHPEV